MTVCSSSPSTSLYLSTISSTSAFPCLSAALSTKPLDPVLITVSKVFITTTVIKKAARSRYLRLELVTFIKDRGFIVMVVDFFDIIGIENYSKYYRKTVVGRCYLLQGISLFFPLPGRFLLVIRRRVKIVAAGAFF